MQSGGASVGVQCSRYVVDVGVLPRYPDRMGFSSLVVVPYFLVVDVVLVGLGLFFYVLILLGGGSWDSCGYDDFLPHCFPI